MNPVSMNNNRKTPQYKCNRVKSACHLCQMQNSFLQTLQNALFGSRKAAMIHWFVCTQSSHYLQPAVMLFAFWLDVHHVLIQCHMRCRYVNLRHNCTRLKETTTAKIHVDYEHSSARLLETPK